MKIEDMEIDGYQKERLTMSGVWANSFSLLILIPIILIFGLPYYLIWVDGSIIESIYGEVSFLTLFAMFILGIVLHELIHGIFFAKYAKNGFKSIKFGILWKYFAPYCHCKEPLNVGNYIVAVIMPTIILGVLPSIISILTGNILLLFIGVIFTVAGAGDILILYSLRKTNKTDFIMDHPSEIGCYVFRKIL